MHPGACAVTCASTCTRVRVRQTGSRTPSSTSSEVTPSPQRKQVLHRVAVKPSVSVGARWPPPTLRAAQPTNAADAVARALRGGYPEARQRSDPSRVDAWYRNYINEVVHHEIADLATINGLLDMPTLLQLLAHRRAGLLNIARLARDANLAPQTARRYLALLIEAFLVALVPAWTRSGRKRLVKSRSTATEATERAVPDALSYTSNHRSEAANTTLVALRSAVSASTCGIEGIDHRDTGAHQIGDVTRRDSQPMHVRGRREQRVDDRQRIAAVHPAPSLRDLSIDGQHPLGMIADDATEPGFQYEGLLLVATADTLDPATNFTYDQHTQVDLVRHPLGHPPTDCRIRSLTLAQF